MLKSKGGLLGVLSLLLVTFLMLSVFSCDLLNDEWADWPERPIEWVLSVSTGGGTDIFARNLAPRLESILGVSIRISNMPGEGPAYAYEQPVDGYTWTTTDEIAIVPVYIEGADFHLDSWTPVAIVQQDPRWLISLEGSQFTDIEKLIEYAKENRVTVGGVQPFGPDRLLVFYLNKYAGTDLAYIPYDSSSEVITAAKGGVIDLMTGSLVSFIPMLEAGEINLLMIASEERVDRFPDVPTARELGYDMVIASYRGIGVHIDTPQEIQDIIAEAVAEAIETEAYRNYEETSYLDLVPGVLYFDDAREKLQFVYDYTLAAWNTLMGR